MPDPKREEGYLYFIFKFKTYAIYDIKFTLRFLILNS